MTSHHDAANVDRLSGRVLNAVPAAGYEMQAFLSLLSVEVSDTVPTASVTCERRPVLRINPTFVAAHCRTDEHLFLLVMHELHHVLLGHTRLFTRATPAHNIAFDAVINAMLCLRFPQSAYTSFFQGLYGGQQDVLRLLAPQRVGCTTGVRALDQLHALLYARDSAVTAEEVFRRLTQALGSAGGDEPVKGTAGNGPPSGNALPEALVKALLGSHYAADEDWGTSGALDADIVSAIRRLVEKWPPPEQRQAGCDLGDVLSRRRVSVVRSLPARVHAAMKRALSGAAAVPGRTRVYAEALVPGRVPVPDWRDRKACTLHGLGEAPLLFDTMVLSRRGRTRECADVYLDVSGSMDGYMPALCCAIRAHRDLVSEQVHLFSTQVVTVPREQVGHGHTQSTGGTDIGCVLEHVLSRKARTVLLVTDGYVGQPTGRTLQRLRHLGCEVRVLLTPDGWRSDLASIAARVDLLPTLVG